MPWMKPGLRRQKEDLALVETFQRERDNLRRLCPVCNKPTARIFRNGSNSPTIYKHISLAKVEWPFGTRRISRTTYCQRDEN